MINKENKKILNKRKNPYNLKSLEQYLDNGRDIDITEVERRPYVRLTGYIEYLFENHKITRKQYFLCKKYQIKKELSTKLNYSKINYDKVGNGKKVEINEIQLQAIRYCNLIEGMIKDIQNGPIVLNLIFNEEKNLKTTQEISKLSNIDIFEAIIAIIQKMEDNNNEDK